MDPEMRRPRSKATNSGQGKPHGTQAGKIAGISISDVFLVVARTTLPTSVMVAESFDRIVDCGADRYSISFLRFGL